MKMIIINIILSTFSLLAILLAVIFDGKLKKDSPDDINIKDFKKEISNLSIFGWILIFISVIVGFGNGYNSIKTIEDNEKQYAEDTIRLMKIINELDSQRTKDSIEINNLKREVTNNGLKSDSIKLAVVDNAIRELEEQKKRLQKENQNTYIHFKNEIEENLKKIISQYQKDRIMGFGNDSLYFTATRLSNKYILKYESISKSDIIITYLMETSELIDKVNMYANQATNSSVKSQKQVSIRMFLTNLEILQNLLYNIYNRVLFVENYQDYEKIDFSKPLPDYDKEKLDKYIIIDWLKKQGYKK